VLVRLVGATVNALGLRFAILNQILHRVRSQKSLVNELAIAWEDILGLLHRGQLRNALVVRVEVGREVQVLRWQLQFTSVPSSPLS
jgi:hypothetical protein